MESERRSHGESSDAGASPGGDRDQDRPSQSTPEFSCHICLETANDPVVSRCGHLFCWPCIHRWMETERGNQCPVCKAGISEENVVPIYLGGRTADNDDPRKRAPPRPQGQRPAPDPNHAGADGGLFGGGGNNGFHFSLGFGAFPFFGLHATQNFGNPFAAHHHPQQHAQHLHHDPDSVAQRAFLILGVLCVLWLLL